MPTLFKIITTIQQTLFPALEKELAAPLGDKGQLFVAVAELAQPERFAERFEWQGVGCPRKWRLPVVFACIAKAVWNLPTTRALMDRLAHDPTLRRLCGWDKASEIPSEATFSRAFAEFARAELPQAIHETLVKSRLGEQKLVGHISRDATAIEGREKAAPKPPAAPKPKRRRGRPKKSDPPRPKPEPTRLEVQGGRSVEENLADLPRACDCGAKKNSKGHNQYWRGYKLHLDVADGEIPVSAILTSASLHDSQAAIPLAQLSARRVVNLYDVMDKGGTMRRRSRPTVGGWVMCRSSNRRVGLGHRPRRWSRRGGGATGSARRWSGRTRTSRTIMGGRRCGCAERLK